MRPLFVALLFAAAPTRAQPPAALTGEGLVDFARSQLDRIDGFSAAEQRSACGPIAAEAMIRFFYQDPGYDAIGDLKRVGRARGFWNAAGMAGPGSEQKLLSHMRRELRLYETWVNGYRSRAALDADANLAVLGERIVASLERGYPVILSTSRHYFFIEGHDRAGSFYVGNTGLIMAYRGLGAGPWMTLADMARNGDLVNGLLVPVEALADDSIAQAP